MGYWGPLSDPIVDTSVSRLDPCRDNLQELLGARICGVWETPHTIHHLVPVLCSAVATRCLSSHSEVHSDLKIIHSA